MSADSKVSLENNSKISFVKPNKSQSLLLLNNSICKCNKKTNTKKNIYDKWNMYVHTDANDKYLILLNNVKYKNIEK